MPELPEVQALVDFLAERTDGLAIERLELASFSVLKTFDPPPAALEGSPIDGVNRHGKFLDVDADGTHLRLPPRPRRLAALVRPAARDRRAAGEVPDRVAAQALRRVGLRPHRGGHEEVARRLHRARPRRRPRASRASDPTRSPTTSPVRRSARSSTAAAPRSRACSATRRSSPASATPTPTRSSMSPSCRPSRSPARSPPRSSITCMPLCATRSSVRSRRRRANPPRS